MRFFKPKVVVVELEPKELLPLTTEDQDAVLALASHPGFIFLTRKLRLMQKYYEKKLTSEIRTDIREVDQLQSAVYWSGWLQSQVSQMLQKEERARNRPTTPDEEDVFQKALSALEEIGRK